MRRIRSGRGVCFNTPPWTILQLSSVVHSTAQPDRQQRRGAPCSCLTWPGPLGASNSKEKGSTKNGARQRCTSSIIKPLSDEDRLEVAIEGHGREYLALLIRQLLTAPVVPIRIPSIGAAIGDLEDLALGGRSVTVAKHLPIGTSAKEERCPTGCFITAGIESSNSRSSPHAFPIAPPMPCPTAPAT